MVESFTMSQLMREDPIRDVLSYDDRAGIVDVIPVSASKCFFVVAPDRSIGDFDNFYLERLPVWSFRISPVRESSTRYQ